MNNWSDIFCQFLISQAKGLGLQPVKPESKEKSSESEMSMLESESGFSGKEKTGADYSKSLPLDTAKTKVLTMEAESVAVTEDDEEFPQKTDYALNAFEGQSQSPKPGCSKENKDNSNGSEKIDNGHIGTGEGDDEMDDDDEEELLDDDGFDDDYDDEFFNFDDHFGEALKEDAPKKPEKKPEELEKTYYGFEKFSFVQEAHESHKFKKDLSVPCYEGEFKRAYQRDLKLLQEGLPDGIFVKAYEDRMDLFSALIVGPEKTPYEGGLFAFDIKLPNNYPHVPPSFYFISFTKDRLNPNLYAQCGKVCVSLLGTWSGKDSCERWSSQSSILQVLLSIQALILVPEPYFNEPGHEVNRKHSQTNHLSKAYNENVIILLFQAMAATLQNPPFMWQFECIFMLKKEIPRMTARLEAWLKLGGNKVDAPDEPSTASTTTATTTVKEDQNNTKKDDEISLPDFPLLPFHRSFEVLSAIRYLKAQRVKFCTI